MDWTDYEFIADVPPEADPQLEGDLTGWELVIFVLEDEEDADQGTSEQVAQDDTETCSELP